MTAKHTPGPWSAHPRDDGPVDLLTPEWYCIDGPGSDVYGHMTAADACLISAAPDLLAACQAIVRYQKLVETDATTGLIAAYAEAFEGAEVAIKKATGDKK